MSRSRVCPGPAVAKGGPLYKVAAKALKLTALHNVGSVTKSSLPPPEPEIRTFSSLFSALGSALRSRPDLPPAFKSRADLPAAQPALRAASVFVPNDGPGPPVVASEARRGSTLLIPHGHGHQPSMGLLPSLGSTRLGDVNPAGPVNGGLDVGRWDQDDLDLRELLERLEHHHGVIVGAFEDASGATAKVATELHDEFAAVKRMLTVVSQVIVADGHVASVSPKLQVGGGARCTSCGGVMWGGGAVGCVVCALDEEVCALPDAVDEAMVDCWALLRGACRACTWR